MARVTQEEMTAVVYYANAWCDEYSGDRPYRVKDFVRLLKFEAALKQIAGMSGNMNAPLMRGIAQNVLDAE